MTLSDERIYHLKDLAKSIICTAVDDGIRVQLDLIIKLIASGDRQYSIEEYYELNKWVRHLRPLVKIEIIE